MISREGLIRLYRLQASLFDRDRGGLEAGRKRNGIEYATFEDLKKLQEDMDGVLNDNKKERENFMRFMKAFQEKFVVLENQMKLLEQPKKRWYKFWS